MSINTQGYRRCTNALNLAYELLQKASPDDVMNDIYRAACTKEFELVLGQGGHLLQKALRAWFVSHAQVDRLVFKDIFRHAAKHGLITMESCKRWLVYRDCRNDTAHQNSEKYADSIMALLPQFIVDAQQLAIAVEDVQDD